jgi:hypothetical protein
MTDYQTLIDRYVSTWNETDPLARRSAIDGLWAEDGSYTDPIAVAEGCAAIDATIAAIQAQFPGLVLRLSGPVDGHHNLARFSWHLGPAGGEPIVIGFDVAVLAGDRIESVHGFLDKVPAAA